MTGGEHPGGSAVETIELELPVPADHANIEVTLSTGAGDLLGRWTFNGARSGPATVTVDWLAAGLDAVSLRAHGVETGLKEGEFDAATVVRPEMELSVSAGGLSQSFTLRVTDTAALERYYQQESHQDEYVVQHPFFHSFHRARLRTLGHAFRKHIKPGSRVLDVGSGYSIFFLITTEWDFKMTCCDLDSAAMRKMSGLVPKWEWVVADAADLPWDDASFDVVYAGEIIEHMPDPASALSEWRRVLAPGGTLILSTPNRDRLLARANNREMPVHPEHVREMNLPELEAALTSRGFEVLKVTGIYLELVLNWYRPPGLRVDMLVSLADKPAHGFLYRPLMSMGMLAPRRAYDLVAVCRRR